MKRRDFVARFGNRKVLRSEGDLKREEECWQGRVDYVSCCLFQSTEIRNKRPRNDEDDDVCVKNQI